MNSLAFWIACIAIVILILFGFFLYVRKYRCKAIHCVFSACCKCCSRFVGYSKVRHTLEDYENEAFQVFFFEFA